ncbi:MAG: MFS transporter [Candidatus Hydrogenedens sp.]
MSILVSTNQKDLQDINSNYIDKNKNFFVIDATLAQGMTSLSTGAFLSAFALYLGASYVVVGLLNALIPLAQILQIPATFLVERYPKRKFIALFALTLSRVAVLFCGLIPIFFIKSQVLPIFFVLYVIYVSSANVGGCAFSTWFRDFFNPETFYQVLTQRFIFATLLGAVASFIGALGLEFIKNNHSQYMLFGYSGVFTLAGILGLGSSIAIHNVRDLYNPFYEQSRSSHQSYSFWKPFKESLKNTYFRKTMIFCIIWNAIFNFANPFLPVFLMKRIGYSLLIIICLTVLNQFANVISFAYWKKFSTRYGNRSLLYLCIPIFFATVFSWFISAELKNDIIQWYLILFLHVISGICVAGINLCLTNLIFSTTPRGKATAPLALNSSLNGLVAGIAPILAGYIAEYGTVLQIPLSTYLHFMRIPLRLFFAPIIQITGLDLVMIISGVIGICSVIFIHFLIPVHVSAIPPYSSAQE